MNVSRRILFTAVFLLIGGTVFQGARALAQQRTQLLTSRQRAADMEKQIAAQHLDHTATTRELTLAESQLAKLPDPSHPTATPAERAHDAEIASWLVRVKRLKQLFTENSKIGIPELRSLTDADWLRAAKEIDFEHEDAVRKTLSSLRTLAKNRFTPQLNLAVRQFASIAGGEPPQSIAALAAFLENPADSDVLERYEITRNSAATRLGGSKWALQERVAVDADYDNRITIGPRGSGNQNAPMAWIPNFNERSKAASEAFTNANKGVRPESPTQLIPYFNPPLDPADTARILKISERARPR